MVSSWRCECSKSTAKRPWRWQRRKRLVQQRQLQQRHHTVTTAEQQSNSSPAHRASTAHMEAARSDTARRNHCLGDKLCCHPLNDCLDLPPPCPLCLAHSARRSWASDAAVRRCRLLVAVCHSPPSDAPPLVPRRFVGLSGAGAVKQNQINEGLYIKVGDFDAQWLPALTRAGGAIDRVDCVCSVG